MKSLKTNVVDDIDRIRSRLAISARLSRRVAFVDGMLSVYDDVEAPVRRRIARRPHVRSPAQQVGRAWAETGCFLAEAMARFAP